MSKNSKNDRIIPRVRKRQKPNATALHGSDQGVGYKRPPKNKQFKPGHSGNPGGRPRGSRNTSLLLRERLDDVIIVLKDGVEQEVGIRDLMISAIFDETIKKRSLQHMELILDLENDAEKRLEQEMNMDDAQHFDRRIAEIKSGMRETHENAELVMRWHAMQERKKKKKKHGKDDK